MEELKQARIRLWSEIYEIVNQSDSDDKDELLEYLDEVLKRIE